MRFHVDMLVLLVPDAENDAFPMIESGFSLIVSHLRFVLILDTRSKRMP